MGVGHRLGPDQKSAPVLVFVSGGKLNRSCEMGFRKEPTNSFIAHMRHDSKSFGNSSKSVSFKMTMESGELDENRSLNSPNEPDSKYWPTTSGPFLKRPWKRSSAHWIVCSGLLGKFFSVHTGIDFSGGSCEDEYDSVTRGNTTYAANEK